jgi:hypothetical protein
MVKALAFAVGFFVGIQLAGKLTFNSLRPF